jgi:hypothetical protein
MSRVLLGVGLLAAGLIFFAYAFWQHNAPPAPNSEDPVLARAPEHQVLQPQGAKAVAKEPAEGGTNSAGASASSVREQVAVPESAIEMAKRMVAAHAQRTGDRGLDTASIALKNMLAADGGNAQWRPTLAPAEDYAASRDFNPLGRSFGKAELLECQQMIDSYSERIAKAGFESALLTHIGVIRAIEAGDFTEIAQLPSGEIDPAGRAEFEARMRASVAKEGDENYVNTEGRRPGTRRLVYFTRASSPEFFRSRAEQDFLKAELQVALRTYFLRR